MVSDSTAIGRVTSTASNYTMTRKQLLSQLNLILLCIEPLQIILIDVILCNQEGNPNLLDYWFRDQVVIIVSFKRNYKLEDVESLRNRKTLQQSWLLHLHSTNHSIVTYNKRLKQGIQRGHFLIDIDCEIYLHSYFAFRCWLAGTDFFTTVATIVQRCYDSLTCCSHLPNSYSNY